MELIGKRVMESVRGIGWWRVMSNRRNVDEEDGALGLDAFRHGKLEFYFFYPFWMMGDG